MTTARFTLIVPEALNDGTPAGVEQLAAYEHDLLDIVGGYTLISAIGAWRSPAGDIYHEPVRKYELDIADDPTVRDQLLALASRIALELAQDAIYLTVAPIDQHLISASVAA